MLSILISLFIGVSAHAEDQPKQVIASCECVVLNDAGDPIRPAHALVGTPVPVTSGEFDVHGIGRLKSPYERENCFELENGELSMACSIGAVKAKFNAEYRCGEIARQYHPNQIDGFTNGSVDASTCYLSLE